MRRYWKFLVPAFVILGVLVVLMVNLSSNLVYFRTPTELFTDVAPSPERLRLGGQVVGLVVDDFEAYNDEDNVIYDSVEHELEES